ncbi:LTA synthase family protein [Alcaligenes faecalis]|jgi:phosphoglycerol transferase MdoB-like AlkP superfamily enzyme|uniref:LTA synthase family protein n=1 Tax=Alcaligenes faecalis TaxID=511 RepID=A0ABY7N7T2_ALCFA|nr:LTA synthase family protein [Alcaligenes faecalis]MBH0310770.1 LTA synthase family protein [Alcaligenes faecalis]WBM39244.1 LTA synthase family protein [Alcaligenes faecalis]HJE65135.1 LTA synthase family protein [Alcaligenes faecalis]
MRHLVYVFIPSALILLTAFRLAFALWQWPRVRQAGGLLPILIGGLRIDALMIGALSAPVILLAPWLGQYPVMTTVAAIWFTFAWFLLTLLEVSTPQFIIEYDTRPNRLYVDYLKHPQEVMGMLWKGYKLMIGIALIGLGLIVYSGWSIFGHIGPDPVMSWWLRPIWMLVGAALCALAIRGTLAHRPINPSSVAWSSDSMLNTLPLNSLYNVAYAIYSMKNERSAEDIYGGMDAAEMNQIVRDAAAMPAGPDTLPTLHRQTPAQKRERKPNLVLIVEESLGAQYVSNLGGAKLTPELDKLAQTGWNFRRAYATGTRSVRGLEAVSAGFPPTVADAVLRLPGSQTRFFTLAQLLKEQGYRSRFIYGGEAHFDNMKSFFLGNGFDELYEQSSFESPEFVGTWGASDEDMFNKLHQLLGQDKEQPSLTLAFSVSNHSPWEYPAGRIQVEGDPATVENTVRYADWAIGDFFKKARESDYWDNTVFLIVADHDSRVGGANLVPLRHFHIPALILGAGVPSRQDERIISQIDLAPTLLSLMGIESEHPMIGRDLTQQDSDRAMMQYFENYGYLKGDILTVLMPHLPPCQYRYTAPDKYEPLEQIDEALAKEALAHVLWPSWAYHEQAYTLPHLQKR